MILAILDDRIAARPFPLQSLYLWIKFVLSREANKRGKQTCRTVYIWVSFLTASEQTPCLHRPQLQPQRYKDICLYLAICLDHLGWANSAATTELNRAAVAEPRKRISCRICQMTIEERTRGLRIMDRLWWMQRMVATEMSEWGGGGAGVGGSSFIYRAAS